MRRTVHIVDDDEEVRASLSLLLQALGYETSLHETGDIFLKHRPALDSALVLLDIRMPGRDGMEILKVIRGQSKSAQVIMMTGHGDIPLAVKAIQNGANDFIEKPFETNRMKTILEKAQSKNLYDPLETLTPREREIAIHLSNGLANKEIAFQLGISSRTVEVHRSRIMTKLSIASPAELVRLMLDT